MSSALRSLPVPTQYYVGIASSGTSVNRYQRNTITGVWSAVSLTGDTYTRGIYRDLGMTVFYNPRDPASGPPVDLRKVAFVSLNGLDVDQVFYIPLGTRVKGTDAQQRADVESCWVSILAAGVAERQFGLRS